MTREASAPTLRVRAVQATPAVLDAEATIGDAATEVEKAGADGCRLVVFPESHVPGYPDWAWRTTPWADRDWYVRHHDNAITPEDPRLEPLCTAAAAHDVWVALGCTERGANGTLYNSVFYIDGDGRVVARHRKLVPTGAERLVWGPGNDDLLTVVEIDGVRVGSLICWENYMPLARVAMYQQGIDVLLSPTWDNSEVWVPTLRHIAKEGRVFVVGLTPFLRGSDMPRDIAGSGDLYGGDDDVMSNGNTTIVAPGGTVLEGPLTGRAGSLTADLDMGLLTVERRYFDPVGHYARPDVLSLAETGQEIVQG